MQIISCHMVNELITAVAFSDNNLETYGRLLTGRKLLKVMSRPHFLSSGFSKASYQSLANSPDSKDKLIMFVITGNSTSKTSGTTEVGTGSSRHVFLPAFLMSSETCS